MSRYPPPSCSLLCQVSGPSHAHLFFPLPPLTCRQDEETSSIILCLLAFHLVAHPVGQSSPTYHMLVGPFLAKLLGGSGPYITGARSTSLQSSIGPGKLPREERSFFIGRAVWREKSFPGSSYRAGINPADPCSKGSRKILTYKGRSGANWM